MRPAASLHALCLTLLVLLAPAGAGAEQAQPAAQPEPALIGLIIDDLGDRLDDGLRTVALPGQVTCAVLPQTTFSRRLAQAAHESGKEVMLHQPMQALSDKAMGPGGMDMHMTRQAMLATLQANLDSVPYVQGLNNHMGSLLTRHPGYMGWLMSALEERGLYFIDSTTTPHTVAKRIALEHRLPAMRRHVFLDHHRDEAQIERQFMHLIEQARSNGYALGIGHPYPETLAVLSRLLPRIEQFGVRLVPVSQLIANHQTRSQQLWQASLSPSHKGAKNSKP